MSQFLISVIFQPAPHEHSQLQDHQEFGQRKGNQKLYHTSRCEQKKI